MWYAVWKALQPQPLRSGMACILTSPRLSAHSPNLGNICDNNGVSEQPYAHSQQLKMLNHPIYVWHECGMQFERFCSLNHCKVAWFANLHHLGFQPTLPNLGNVCGDNGVNVHPYAHPQQLMVINTSYLYDMNVGCSLRGSTASTIAKLHCLYTCIT